MAKKENEENNDVNKESEEDFGLPDLEFEELDDIDVDESEGEDSLEDEIAEIIGEPDDDELVMEDIGVGDSEEEAGSDDDLAEGESLSDLGVTAEGEGTEVSDDLITDSVDEELDEVEKFISEITGEDDTDEVSDDSSDMVESEIEDFDNSEGEGLSDVGTGMFSRDDDDEPAEEEYSSSYESDAGGTSSAFTRIIIFGLVGAVILAFVFLYLNPTSDEEQVAEAETTPVPVVEKPVEETPAVTEQPAEETPATPVKEDPPASVSTQQSQLPVSTGTPGVVTTITSSAGRYYIVVSSFIDSDMANDHGNALAAQGASVKIINPFNERKYYRVSVADYGSRQDAINATEQLKSQYGNDIWALKY